MYYIIVVTHENLKSRETVKSSNIFYQQKVAAYSRSFVTLLICFIGCVYTAGTVDVYIASTSNHIRLPVFPTWYWDSTL